MPETRQRIFVFGASGHAKVVIDILELQGLYEVVFIVDDNLALKGNKMFGCPIVGGKSDLLDRKAKVDAGIVAIGDNHMRREIAAWLTEHGFFLVSAIHPSALLARGVKIEAGTVVMAGCVINPDVRIETNCIINTNATVDHDCHIGPHSHIGPGSTLCGGVTVGRGTLIGAGATIIPNITVGSYVTVGAGATVLSNIPDEVKMVGTPARLLPKRKT